MVNNMTNNSNSNSNNSSLYFEIRGGGDESSSVTTLLNDENDEERNVQQQQQQQHHGQHEPPNNNDNNDNTAPLVDMIEPTYHRPPRLSQLRRESFLVEYSRLQGPPQISFVLMLIALGLGSTIGVVPSVMSDRFARLDHSYDGNDDCSSFPTGTTKPEECLEGFGDAQSAVSFSNLVSNIFTFLFSSLLGSLSDEHGRKPFLMAGLFLSMLPPFFLLLIQLFPLLSPWYYYTSSALTGCVNWTAIAISSLSDVLPQQYRAPGIGLLLAGFMLGFSLSPLLTLLFNNIQLSAVSFTTVIVGFVLTIFYVPETLPPHVAEETKRLHRLAREAEEEEQSMNGNTTASFSKLYSALCTNFLLKPFYGMAILNRNTFFRLISLLAFFTGMVSSGDQVLLIYYLEETLGFTTKDVSKMFLILGLVGLFAQSCLLKPLTQLVGEKYVVAFAFLCGAVDNAMYGLARNKTTIFCALGIAGITGIAFPTISAIKANNVHETEQGRIQGALYSLQALASGLGPVSLKFVYNHTKNTRFGAGSMFLFASCLYLTAVGIALSLSSDKANSASADRCHNNTHTHHNERIPHVDDEEQEYVRLASSDSISSSASTSIASSSDKEEENSNSNYGTIRQQQQSTKQR
jgi:DHA1 family tetracycline resistance protein-like MFS transporter